MLLMKDVFIDMTLKIFLGRILLTLNCNFMKFLFNKNLTSASCRACSNQFNFQMNLNTFTFSIVNLVRDNIESMNYSTLTFMS